MASETIKNMTNLADSGQDAFATDWTMAAKTMMYEMGISKKYLGSADADYILGKAVTDLIEDGDFTATTKEIIKTLRVNHPHSEDKVNV